MEPPSRGLMRGIELRRPRAGRANPPTRRGSSCAALERCLRADSRCPCVPSYATHNFQDHSMRRRRLDGIWRIMGQGKILTGAGAMAANYRPQQGHSRAESRSHCAKAIRDGILGAIRALGPGMRWPDKPPPPGQTAKQLHALADVEEMLRNFRDEPANKINLHGPDQAAPETKSPRAC